jgi:hypothetical protein
MDPFGVNILMEHLHVILNGGEIYYLLIICSLMLMEDLVIVLAGDGI